MRSGHDEIKEMIPEYLEGLLAQEMRKDVEAHLRECRDCRDELFFITELLNVDLPDPGDFFWKTLPQRVRGAVEKESVVRFSLKSLLFRQLLPVTATIAVLFLLIFTYVEKEEMPEFDPFFNAPFTAEVMDYSDITEEDIPLITERLTDDELYLDSEDSMEYSYYREFADLNSKEMDSLYEALKKKQQTGG